MPRQSGLSREERAERGADIEIEGDSDDREQPQYSVEQAHVPVEPARVVVDEWLEYQVKGVDRGQGKQIEKQRLEQVGPNFAVAAWDVGRRDRRKEGRRCTLMLSL